MNIDALLRKIYAVYEGHGVAETLIAYERTFDGPSEEGFIDYLYTIDGDSEKRLLANKMFMLLKGVKIEDVKSFNVRTVHKRNGAKVLVDVREIYEKCASATDSQEQADELFARAHILWHDGITTAKLQESLIHTARSMISEKEPVWEYVAARLLLEDLRQNVRATLDTEYEYPKLQEVIDAGIAARKMHPTFHLGYDLDDLDEHIQWDRDRLFKYIGLQTWMDRYAHTNADGDIIELPQHHFMIVAMYLAQQEEDKQYWARRFYDMLSQMHVMAATPTLGNAATRVHQLSSCFVGTHDDSLEGIMDAYRVQALCSKFGGGLGWDWTMVRSSGRPIAGYSGAAGGKVPFLKIENDLMNAVDQLGRRRGSLTAYVAVWDREVVDVLRMRDKGGEERRKAEDLFPAIVIDDLFMTRVLNDEDITMFSPDEVPMLNETYGKEFERWYLKYENDPGIEKVTMRARDLWKEIMMRAFHNGMPFMLFKDAANRAHEYDGLIRTSNLCMEILQTTEPTREYVRLRHAGSGEEKEYYVKRLVKMADGSFVPAGRLMAGDRTDNGTVESVEHYSEGGLFAICNLASVNLSRYIFLSDEEREDAIYAAMRMLDNVIDINIYVDERIEKHAKLTRAVGLGVMGEFEALVKKGIQCGSEEHERFLHEVYGEIRKFADKASLRLAEERGACRYSGKYRNAYRLAIAPTATISILCGTTPSIEPPYKLTWYEENLSGIIPCVAPSYSQETAHLFRTTLDIDNKRAIELNAIRQQYVDQGISFNMFIDPDKIEKLSEISDLYIKAWEEGLKTVYYLRSQAPDVRDTSIECEGCQ